GPSVGGRLARPAKWAGVPRAVLAQRPVRLKLVLPLAVGILLATVGTVLMRTHASQRKRADAAASQPIRLAVMPFENEGSPADQYFADGLSDEVRGKLSDLATLKVT